MCCVVLVSGARVQELGLVAATQQPSQYQAAIPAVVIIIQSSEDTLTRVYNINDPHPGI